MDEFKVGDSVQWQPETFFGFNFDGEIDYTGTLKHRNPENPKQWAIKWTDGYHDDEDSYWSEYELTHLTKEN